MGISFFLERGPSEQTGDLITFVITVVSMTLAFTLIPLLPTPLPMVMALLIAYTTYRDPPIGAFAGSIVIALGLFYHLSRIGFFELFSNRWLVLIIMVTLLLPFVILSTQLRNNIAVISMDIGLIAVSLLFFRSTFYLAVPVILIFATIYKRRGVFVTFSYYAFMSLPLQVMQYLKTQEEGLPPPLYTPLNSIYLDIQEAMKEVSLTEINKIFRVIGGQIINAGTTGGTIEPALLRFIDSLPGMILFLLIISGLISATAYITLKVPESLKKAKLPGKYSDALIYIIPVGSASITNIIFFILLDNLQGPLAFQALVDIPIVVLSTSFTIVLSVPVSLSKYIVDLREILAIRTEYLRQESESIFEEIRHYLDLIESISDPIPLSFSSLHTKMLITLDELKEVLDKVSVGITSPKEMDSMMRRVFTQLKNEATNLRWQLDVALEDHFVRIKFEYLESVREIRELGLDIDPPEIPDILSDSSLESKLRKIEQVVESGGVLVEELIATSDMIYDIISSLFEPSLPGDSPIIQISREKKESDEPWIIIDAILASLRNWEKQYSAEIIKSTRPIKDSVGTIIELSKRESTLLPILGERFNLIRSLARDLEVKDFEDERNLRVLRVILIRDTIFSTVDVVARVIGILYDHLKELEATIDYLLPMEDYEWNKNLTLVDRMNTSLEVINNYESREIGDIVSHLYRILSYIDEAVDTIEYYNERKELLLNYHILEKKIGRILDERQEVGLWELGVAEKYGREYLKLYLRGHFKEAPLEEVGGVLRRAA